MTREQIIRHVATECAGDNCECCDWPDEDRAVADAVTTSEIEKAMLDSAADFAMLASDTWATCTNLFVEE